MNQTEKFPRPDPDYRCPLCLDHEDDVFVWSPILKQPICDGCDYEIWAYVVTDVKKQPPDPYVITALEKITDLSFDEYRLIELEHAVKVMTEAPKTDVEILPWLKDEIIRLKSLSGHGDPK